jgi:hypothetical protein
MVGLYWRGIIHDLSKFSASEFVAYANNFFNHDSKHKAPKLDFDYAWLHHQHYNKHHWNYWVVDQNKRKAIPIPDKYLLELVCDWRAMARKFNDTATTYYKKNKQKIVMHPSSRKKLESILEI